MFELVPPEFDFHTNVFYTEMGSPLVTWENVWDIYLELNACLEHLYLANQPDKLDMYWEAIEQWDIQQCLTVLENNGEQVPYGLIPGQDLAGGAEYLQQDGALYVGGVNNGKGLGA